MVEVVLAVVVIALTAAALLGAITTSIVSSASHRSLSTDDALLRSYAEEVQNEVEQQPIPLYQPCAQQGASGPYSAITPNFSVPTGYTLGMSQIQYWGNATYLTNSLTKHSPTSTLVVNPLVYQMNANETLVIGNQTAIVTANAMPGATSIQISDPLGGPFDPSMDYPAGPPNPNGTNVTWLYDQGWFPLAACSTSAVAAGALPGNDFQQLTLTVTAPSGITDEISIVVRNPNYV